MSLRCVAGVCSQLPSCDGCSDVCRGSVAVQGTLAVEETPVELGSTEANVVQVRSEPEVAETLESTLSLCGFCLLFMNHNCGQVRNSSFFLHMILIITERTPRLCGECVYLGRWFLQRLLILHYVDTWKH